MAYPRRDDHARIYAEWHRAASERAGAALIALYADDAVLESPLVPAILESKTDGVLRGKAEIAHFLEAGARSRPIDLVRWYRSDTYFSAGSTLVWEYPRETPDGDRVEIVEVMNIALRTSSGAGIRSPSPPSRRRSVEAKPPDGRRPAIGGGIAWRSRYPAGIGSVGGRADFLGGFERSY